MTDKTILLVEDNPDDEALTVRALEKSGIPHRLVVAHDGAEALEYLLGSGTPTSPPPHLLPGLILLDLKLPKVDGHDVLKRIRAAESTRALPVVVFTSSSEINDIRRSYLLGANSYVRKPVDFTLFSEAVRQIGSYWLSLNLAPA